VYRIVDPS
jgi:hypothetical protein